MHVSAPLLLAGFLITFGVNSWAPAVVDASPQRRPSAASVPNSLPQAHIGHEPQRLPSQESRVPSAPRGQRWGLPLDGPPIILRRFAPPAQVWLPGHRGVDLATRPGQVVRAAGPGLVGYAGPLGGRGVVMILHAEGLRTTYLPLHASVRRGQRVQRGDVIGTVEDNVGHCRAHCLHWGLIQTGHYQDPLLLIGHGLVRLLPRWPSLR